MPSAGGQWNGNIYTSANLGNWIITASSGSVSGQASLTVNSVVYSPDDFAHAGVVNFYDVQFFYLAYETYSSTHYCTTSCDFNHDGKINFQDLCWFAIYYIAATKNHLKPLAPVKRLFTVLKAGNSNANLQFRLYIPVLSRQHSQHLSINPAVNNANL